MIFSIAVDDEQFQIFSPEPVESYDREDYETRSPETLQRCQHLKKFKQWMKDSGLDQMPQKMTDKQMMKIACFCRLSYAVHLRHEEIEGIFV